MSSINGSLEADDFFNLGDDGVSTVYNLDDVLNQVDQLDDNMSFLEDNETLSLGDIPSSAPLSSSFSYNIESEVVVKRESTLSHQLYGSPSSSKYGLARVIAAHGNWIAVGTSKGTIFIFDSNGCLQKFLHSSSDHGSVSCLDFSSNGRYLCVGFSKGLTKVMTVKTGTVVHVSNEAAQLNHGILQVLYLPRSSRFLTLDSSGNVFTVKVASNLMGKRTEQFRCIFSGCNGEVVHMRYLENNVLALLTVSKLLLISIGADSAVLASFPLSNDTEYPPVMDFYQNSPEQIALCVGRGCHLFIVSINLLSLRRKRKASQLLVKISLPSVIVSINWMHKNKILVTDASGTIFIVDSDKSTFSTVIDPKLELVFGTSDFKGLSTGGNVSKALQCMAEYVCYQSIAKCSTGVLVLTANDVHTVRILNEYELVQQLCEKKDFISASLYLLDVYKGKIKHSSGSMHNVKHILSDILLKLTSHTLDGCQNGKVSNLLSHYKKCIPVLLHVSIKADLSDFLFQEIWPRLERDTLSRSVLLDQLEEWVLEGAVYNAPPTLISAYLQHLSSEGHFAQFQSAVVHFPIHSVDINHVMTVCHKNGLYDGVIYVLNNALQDFLTPLEEMFEKVSEIVKRGDVFTDFEVEQGNRLLLYIHCCLAGNSYPFGRLPAEHQDTVPLQTYRCLVSIKGKDGSNTGSSYPFLRVLLLFDAQQFFHVICLCIDVPLFQNNEKLQRLCEIIGHIVPDLGSNAILYHYLCFVIQLVENGHITPPTELVTDIVTSFLRCQLLNESAQQAIVNLLRAIPLIDRHLILRLSITPLQSTICSFIYMSERKFQQLVDCYLKEKSENKVFESIRQIFSSDLSHDEQMEFYGYLKSIFNTLLQLDSRKTSMLLLDFFPGEIWKMCQIVDNDQRLITDLINTRMERNETIISGEEETDELFMSIFVDSIVHEDLTKEGIEEKIRITLNYWLPIGSRTDACLNIVSAANLPKSTALFLEARGFVQRAFEKLFEGAENSNESEIGSWIDCILSFCSRHSTLSSENEWPLRLFKTVVSHDKWNNMDAHLVAMSSRIMSSGTEHAHELFSSYLEYEPFRKGTHEEYFSLLDSVISACLFEKSLLENLSSCMDFEMREYVKILLSVSSAQHSHRTLATCIVCSEPATKSAYSFKCGHTVHLTCSNNNAKECVCATTNMIHPLSFASPSVLQVTRKDIFDKWKEVPRLCP